jgi:antitoxin component YwqK of YwqJK toxin-antitoxin module
MKKILLIITSLLFNTSVIFPQSKVNINDLVEVEGKVIRPNSDKPYSGLVFDTYENTGNEKLEGFYRNGLKNGRWTWLNVKENIDSTGKYRNGLKYGQWEFYHENEQLKAKGNYRDGDGSNRDYNGISSEGRHGKWTFWDDNGSKSSKQTWKNGKEEGVFTTWHYNGLKESEITYKDGNVNGIWIYWSKHGEKLWEGTVEEYIAAEQSEDDLAAAEQAEDDLAAADLAAAEQAEDDLAAAELAAAEKAAREKIAAERAAREKVAREIAAERAAREKVAIEKKAANAKAKELIVERAIANAKAKELIAERAIADARAKSLIAERTIADARAKEIAAEKSADKKTTSKQDDTGDLAAALAAAEARAKELAIKLAAAEKANEDKAAAEARAKQLYKDKAIADAKAKRLAEELAADCEKIYNLAQDKYTEGKYQESVELLEITLQMNGCDIEISSKVHYHIGDNYANDQFQLDEARKVYEKVVENYSAGLQYVKKSKLKLKGYLTSDEAEAEYNAGNFKDAVALREKVAQQKGSDKELAAKNQYLAGYIYHKKLNDLIKAKVAYSKAMTIHPKSSYVAKAQNKLTGLNSELTAFCRKIYDLSQEKYRAGQYQESVEILDITTRMEGCDEELRSRAQFYIGWNYANDQFKTDEAKKAYLKVIEIYPADFKYVEKSKLKLAAYLISDEAEAAYKAGDITGAVAIREKVAQQKGCDRELAAKNQYLAGYIYQYKLNDPDKAKVAYSKVLIIHPKSDYTTKAQQKLAALK